MSQVAGDAHRLISYYRGQVRPALSQAPELDLVPQLDRLADAIEARIGRLVPLQLGFLGESQVGKSTLINALLDRRALPSGGVGPLTAQAIRVRLGEDERFEVQYHGRREVNRLRFALEREAERQGLLPRESKAERPEEEEENQQIEVEATPQEDNVDEPTQRNARLEVLAAQARRLLTTEDEDEPSLPELIGGLRQLLEMAARPGATGRPTWAARLKEIATKLGQTEDVQAVTFEKSSAFSRELRLRAAGWLAPLVSRLELRLAQPILAHVDLVDLPGIGVVGDDASQVAGQYVRAEADALVVVVRNNGITELLVSALESADVLTRLNFDTEGLRLIVAVTHLDDTAHDRHREQAAEAEEDGAPVPTLDEVFDGLRVKQVAVIRRQLGQALRQSRTYRSAEPGERVRWDQVIDVIATQAEIHCVAAHDYQNSAAGRIGRAASGVDALRAALIRLGEGHINRQERALHEQLQSLRSDLASALAQLRGGLHDEIHSDEERRALVTAVDAVAGPLQAKLKAYQGETQQFLSGTMREVLKRLIVESTSRTGQHLTALIHHGRTMNVRSLQAAMRRNGVFDKRAIDYPGELTRTFVNHIAAAWKTQVLDKVREHLKQSIERKRKLVEQLLAGTSDVAEDRRLAARAILASLEVRGRTFTLWSDERLEKFRRTVHDQVHGVVAKLFTAACADAIQRGIHVRNGARDRILHEFNNSGHTSIQTAGVQAQALLLNTFDELRIDIQEQVLNPTANPVTQAADLLKPADRPMPEEERKARRTRLETTDQLIRALPVIAEAGSE